MNFGETEEHALIRDAVRSVCADFPDEYWSRLDSEHRFPWDFYNAMAKAGWIGIAIPEAYGGSGRGIARSVDRARGSRRIRRGDERGERDSPVDLRHASGRTPRQRRR